jgi:hypothetical protein
LNHDILDFGFWILDWGAAAPGRVSVPIFVSRGSAQSKIENPKSKM